MAISNSIPTAPQQCIEYRYAVYCVRSGNVVSLLRRKLAEIDTIVGKLNAAGGGSQYRRVMFRFAKDPADKFWILEKTEPATVTVPDVYRGRCRL